MRSISSMPRRKLTDIQAMELLYAKLLAQGIPGKDAYARACSVTEWTDSDRAREYEWRHKPNVQAIVEAANEGRAQRCMPIQPGLDWAEVASLVAAVARIDHQGDPAKARAVIDALRFWRTCFGSALPTVKAEAVAEIELRFEDTTGL
jgi:hypothetical protein